MTLLYLALAYMMGIAAGGLLWQAGPLDCNLPKWLWLLPLFLLPFTPALSRFERKIPHSAMRWPVRAGFVPPRVGPSYALLAALPLCLLAGILRYGTRPMTPCLTPSDLAYWNLPATQSFDRKAKQVEIEGYVSGYALIKDTAQQIDVRAENIIVDKAVFEVDGLLRMRIGSRPRYAYGQPLRLSGRLATPPDFDTFSYREYLARRGIHSMLYDGQVQIGSGERRGNWLWRMLFALRSRGERVINRALPEPQAALANGMLLGIDWSIPTDLYDQFRRTGASHVIVISGSNVALIAGVLLALSWRVLGRRRAALPALVGIACYALLVGGDAAVLRAALMGGLVVVAMAMNRRATALVSLGVACWVMTLANPLALWDVGFQLSGAATAGLVLFLPVLSALFARVWPGPHGYLTASSSPVSQIPGSGTLSIGHLLRGLVVDGLAVSLSASIMVLPLVAYHFKQVSTVFLLTNLLIVPVQPLITVWGSAGVLAGILGLSWLAYLPLWVAWLGISWTVAVVNSLAGIPGAIVEVQSFGLGSLVLTYTVILACRWYKRWIGPLRRAARWTAANWPMRLAGPVLAGALAIAAALIWTAVSALPDGLIHVYFLDVRQGDGIFIQTPSGRQVLVDGGQSPQRLLGQLGDVMPYWDRSLDLLVLTHPDQDHMAAQMEAPWRLDVAHALESEAGHDDADGELWRQSLVEAGVLVKSASAGGWIDLGDGVALWVLWPSVEQSNQSPDNENSLVMKLVYGNFSVLLTGDLGHSGEAQLLAQDAPLQSVVLKVGHHGSSTSTGAAFVQAVNPQIAVIQVGADNEYGHPTQEVLENLDGRTVLRNDRHGRIHIASDGRQMWVDSGTP